MQRTNNNKTARKPDTDPAAAWSGTLCVGAPGFSDVLQAELIAQGHRVDVVAPGIVGVHGAARVAPIAFAHAVLPRAMRIRVLRPAELLPTIAASALVRTALRDGAVVVGLAPPVERRGSATLGTHPFAAIANAAARTLQPQPRAASTSSTQLVVLVTAQHEAYVALIPSARDRLSAWPAPLLPHTEAARDAPSSAHRKLEEATSWIGMLPTAGDVVLDLGAAPGGWSRACLDTGARVIAVDRADMSPDVLRDKHLTHVRADAFAFAPPDDVTWVICDIIAAPERTLALLERMLVLPSAQAFVFTIKLTRPVDLAVLRRCFDVVTNAADFTGRVVHLVANKCEVTVLLRRLKAPGRIG